jgi:hypothetical protein
MKHWKKYQKEECNEEPLVLTGDGLCEIKSTSEVDLMPK